MRILVVSDLHYTLRQLDWVVEAAPGFDVVVMAGDHLDISSSVALDSQIVVVLDYFALLAAATETVIVNSGNHDLTGPDGQGEQAALWLQRAANSGVHTDGESLIIGDTLITICPWWDGPIGRQRVAEQLAADAARRPERWVWVYHWPPTDSPTSWTGRAHYGDADLASWIGRQRVAEQLAADAERRPERWVWVYHWPPTDSPTSWTGRAHYGDADLASWIGEHHPDVVLTGHVHQPPFKPEGSWVDRIGDTWVFNPGRQTGDAPARIEIDLELGVAAWFSMMGVEEADLAMAVAPARTVF